MTHAEIAVGNMNKIVRKKEVVVAVATCCVMCTTYS